MSLALPAWLPYIILPLMALLSALAYYFLLSHMPSNDTSTMEGYNNHIERIRAREYPMLSDEVYLDHAGTTLYPKTLMQRFSQDMIANLYGNPHSASPSSQLSTERVEHVRMKLLHFFNASPDHFDVVFVANATAGMKLVMDSFRSVSGGFSYIYHKDAHTSMVGIKEHAIASICATDNDIEAWLAGASSKIVGLPTGGAQLFAYTGQSNMDGRKLPLSWAARARSISNLSSPYVLLDAAALVSTSPLDLSMAANAPDFITLSLNKIFGFPDLGILIVRKASGEILRSRQYFGGGTVDLVLCVEDSWHVSKQGPLHQSLEDGTLPIHNIIATDLAMDVHTELYGSMAQTSAHTAYLAYTLYKQLQALRHSNGTAVCDMHAPPGAFDADTAHYGPTVTFNVRRADGGFVSNSEVERLASIKRFHIRTGGVCNPGGIATALGLSAAEMRLNFAAGVRCGSGNDMLSSGRPIGIIRASFGAMNIMKDVDTFVSFVKEFYATTDVLSETRTLEEVTSGDQILRVERLTIFPIKSCGGYDIPRDTDWQVRPEGFAWDREWCLISAATGQAISQKRCPKMALLRPEVDLAAEVLRVRYVGPKVNSLPREIIVPFSADPAAYQATPSLAFCASRVCGDAVSVRPYASNTINGFFSTVLGMPCTLARFPPGGTGRSARHAKAHMQRHQPKKVATVTSNSSEGLDDTATVFTPPDSDSEASCSPILLSNESPILMINRSSLNALNSAILTAGGKVPDARVFRANIVVASTSATPTTTTTQDEAVPSSSNAYAEDHWTSVRIGRESYRTLGSCRRCHMVCVNQETAQKDVEPYITLAKTRRFDDKIFFGVHICHVPGTDAYPTIRVGDQVLPVV